MLSSSSTKISNSKITIIQNVRQQKFILVNLDASRDNLVKLMTRTGDQFQLDQLQMSQKCHLVWSDETNQNTIRFDSDRLTLGQYQLNKKLIKLGTRVEDIQLYEIFFHLLDMLMDLLLLRLKLYAMQLIQ